LKKTTAPPGLRPRNAQAWVIGGISVLMILVIALSGRTPAKARAGASTAGGVDTSTMRIEDYKRQIDQEAEKLRLEKAQLARTQNAMTGLPPATVPESAAYVQTPPRPAAMALDSSFETD